MQYRSTRLGRSLALPFAIFMIAGVFSMPAHAHKLSIFATLSNGEIHGKVYYPTGAAPGLKVQAMDAEGKPVNETVSGADGRFTLPAPSELPVTVMSETEDGHRAEFTVEPAIAELEPQTSEAEKTSPVEPITENRVRAIVQEELQPLREQLAEQSGRSRARDIFGGVGYIVGVFGLIVLLRRSSGKSS